MATPPLSDADYAEALAAKERYGQDNEAAAASLGLNVNTFRSRVRRAREYGLADDPAIQAAKEAVGTRMTPVLAWAKTKSETGDSYSVLLKPQSFSEDLLDRLGDAFQDIPAAAPIAAPQNSLDDLCTLYPLMDGHIGMQAWGRETGGPDYDLKLAERDMHHAFAKLAILTPRSRKAILLIGGDFFHADDENAETPKSKHKLDVDGRHWKVLDVGVALIAAVIENLAAKHSELLVRVMRGNHDENSHLILNFSLAERYRDNPRVHIEKEPRDLFMMQWGRCMIAAHHGDKAKPERLAMLLSDVCPFWSATRHRHVFTGHVHHDAAKDIGPLRWESLRAFCPPDSYAASMGYGGRRALQSVTFHKNDGIVLRALDPIERAA